MPGVQPEKLLHDLSELWTGLGKEETNGQGVLRACAMTFLVITEKPGDVNIGETLAALMPEQPSRAIVVILDPEAEFSARVFAQCWMPFGSRQQICCEQIEITTSPSELKDVPTVILGLIVPDLPVVLWSRCPHLFDMPEFHDLLPLIDKLIMDSNVVADPPAFLARMTALPGTIVADLAWTRLTRWRETIAAVFENPQFLDALPQINEIVVSYSGEVPPTRAWYLAAWLSACIGGNRRPELKRVDDREPGIRAVLLRGGTMTVSLSLSDGSTAELRAGSLVTRMVFQRPNECLLLREELSILGPDPIFEDALARAAAISHLP